ncbi:MAG: hypothetical protein AAF411_18500 [Myxococcota bacterium]
MSPTRWAGLALLAVACTVTTRADYHGVVLEPFARQRLDCEHGEIEVVDATPEDFVYGRDRQAGRYEVVACGREGTFVCFTLAEGNVASSPECRRLGEQPSRVYVGDYPVR